MSSHKTLVSSLFVAFALLFSLAQPHHAMASETTMRTGVMKVHPLTGYGAKLWAEGRLVDDEGREWAFTLMPGHKNIWTMAVWGWSTAKGQFVKIFSRDLYVTNMWGEAKRGGRMVSSGISFSYHTGLKGYLLEELPKDFSDIGREVSAAYSNGSPGWLFASAWSVISGAFECGYDVVAAGVCTVGGMGYSAVGVGYSVVGPALVWAWQPVSAALAAIVPGAVIPGGLYVWNGAGWLAINGEALTSRRQVTDQTWWFSLDSSSVDPTTNKPRVLSINALNTIIEASLTKALNKPQLDAIQGSLDSLGEKIKAVEEREERVRAELSLLQDEKTGLIKQYNAQQDAEKTKPSVSALHRLISDSWQFSSTDFDETTRSILLDDQKLRSLILAVAKNAQINLSSAQVEEVLQSIKENVKSVQNLG